MPDKEQQTEINSDSDNENTNAENRASATNNNTTDSLKENLSERVTMATTKENHQNHPHHHQQQHSLNNNNNNINILSATTMVNAAAPAEPQSSNPHAQSTPSTYHQMKTETPLYASIGHSSTYTSSGNNTIGYSAPQPGSRSETSTIDSSVLKTISAPCS